MLKEGGSGERIVVAKGSPRKDNGEGRGGDGAGVDGVCWDGVVGRGVGESL